MHDRPLSAKFQTWDYERPDRLIHGMPLHIFGGNIYLHMYCNLLALREHLRMWYDLQNRCSMSPGWASPDWRVEHSPLDSPVGAHPELIKQRFCESYHILTCFLGQIDMRHPAVARWFYVEKNRSQLLEPDISILNQPEQKKNKKEQKRTRVKNNSHTTWLCLMS